MLNFYCFSQRKRWRLARVAAAAAASNRQRRSRKHQTTTHRRRVEPFCGATKFLRGLKWVCVEIWNRKKEGLAQEREQRRWKSPKADKTRKRLCAVCVSHQDLIEFSKDLVVELIKCYLYKYWKCIQANCICILRRLKFYTPAFKERCQSKSSWF